MKRNWESLVISSSGLSVSVCVCAHSHPQRILQLLFTFSMGKTVFDLLMVASSSPANSAILFFQYYKGLAFNFCGNELVILLFKRPGFVSKLILTLNFTEHSAILLFSVRLESLCFFSFLRWFIASPCNLIPDNHIY